MKAIRAAKWGYIISSVIFCIAGILLMLYPEISAAAVCNLMGIFLMLYGIIKIIGYLSKDLYRLAFQFDLASGLMFFTIGLVMLIQSREIIFFLYFVIGIIVFSDGLFKLQIAVDAKRFGLSKWWMIGGISILVCIFGLLLILNPFKSALLIMTLMGITLLLEGVLNLCVAIYTVKILKKKKPDVIDFFTEGDRND